VPGDRLAVPEGVADVYLLSKAASAGVICVEWVLLLL
jgi:hypothetical protein